MTNVLVNGASGFVGMSLISALADAGFSGLVVSRRPILSLSPSWEWRHRSQLLNEHGNANIDWLIHLEVKQHVQSPSQTECAEFLEVNVSGTKEWLTWAERSGVKCFVFFSSIKAVGDSLDCQDENTTSSPTSAYGQSKLAAEHLVRDWAAAEPDRSALILRPAVVYGPGNKANLLSFVKAIDKGRFFLAGRNDNIKSVVSLRNLCAAVEHLIPRMKPGVEVFNLVDAHSYSVRELAFMIARLLGTNLKQRHLPLSLARAAARVGDVVVKCTHSDFPLTTSRLRALIETTHFSCEKLVGTGFRHPQTTEQGLAEMIAWYRRDSDKSA